MHISDTSLEIQREPFARPFGFKGAAFHEKWNLVVRLTDASGQTAVGIGGLAVLWSDADVFFSHTEVGGNVIQTALLEHALQLVKERPFKDPPEMFQHLLPQVYEYGRAITRNPDLKLTFCLIALVALDNAAWLLQAKQQNISTFDDLIPTVYRDYLTQRQKHIATVPAVGYTLPAEELRKMLNDGAYVLKIKIGHPGTEEDMVQADMDRLDEIHRIACDLESPMTDSGSICYYLDANGRYGRKDSMARLLDHAKRRGMLDRIILIEEPFHYPDTTDVHGLPALFAADESLQTVGDVATRIEQGYGAVTIKPAGKTLSMSFETIQAATDAGAACIVADNACVPVLVEWNKNVAARLPGFPGIKGGMMESNGPENYGGWVRLLSEFPIPNASWLSPQDGAFKLDETYYALSGGIFQEPRGYANLLR